jgi:hypothetical protein
MGKCWIHPADREPVRGRIFARALTYLTDLKLNGALGDSPLVINMTFAGGRYYNNTIADRVWPLRCFAS